MDIQSRILHEFQRGKPALLYQHLYPLLLNFAKRYLRERFCLAEDYVQNAIINAWRQKNSLHSYPALKTYLLNSIRNQTVSSFRKENARTRYVNGLSDAEEDFFHGSIIVSETETVLHNAINGLPGKERRICELSFFEGMKNIDIAKMLNVSDSTVKKQKASALALLRKKLESYSG